MLGDITIIHSTDDAARQRLQSVLLGNAPRIGVPVRLQRRILQRWVQTRVGGLSKRIEWAGSDESQLSLATRILPGEKICSMALNAMRAFYYGSPYKAEIRPAGEIAPILIPVGNLDLKIRDQANPGATSTSGVLSSRRRTVWVDVWVDNLFVRSVPVGVLVSLAAPASVAARNLVAGDVLSQKDIEVREVEWAGRMSPLFKPMAPLGPTGEKLGCQPIEGLLPQDVRSDESGVPVGLRMRHSIQAGSPLTQSHVEPLPLVLRNQFVTLRASQGDIEVESFVEALEDGLLGQVIRVKLAKTGSSIPVRVIAARVVEVLP